MERRGNRGLFRAYIRSYWRDMAAFGLFAGIFWVVLALYGAGAEAALYAAGLCVLAGTALLAAGYARFRREHMRRLAALENLLVLTEPLPPAGTPAEADFRAMAQRMKEAYGALATETERSRREDLDWFTAWVHQIKTPIAVMRLTLQAEDTTEHRALETELFRIGQYAQMALTYLRLGEGTGDLRIETVALDGVIRQAVHKYAPQFVQRKLYLRYDGTDARVLTDEKWLSFILEQLLDNAVKYTVSGGVTISVSPEKVLSVSDTGIGVEQADLPRIFEKGFTGFNGRTDKTATGLGLYLCRQAADRLRHRLWAVSEPGKGSTFYLDMHSDKLEVE